MTCFTSKESVGEGKYGFNIFEGVFYLIKIAIVDLLLKLC